MIRLLFVLFVPLLLFTSCDLNYESEYQTELFFIHSESRIGALGEVFMNNVSLGFLEDGLLTVPSTNLDLGVIRLETFFRGDNYSFEYIVDEDYSVYDSVEFEFSNNDMSDYLDQKEIEQKINTKSNLFNYSLGDSITRNFSFCRTGVVGTRERLTLDVYSDLDSYLFSLERLIYYDSDDSPPTERDFLFKTIDEPNQLVEVKVLAEKIKLLSNDSQEQARIAITLVQMIPYDNYAIETFETHVERYPYEVLFDYTGICGEKSELIVMLLRELGFGSAYIIFPEENHAIAGISCPKEFSFRTSGYCFVESTESTQIGQSDGNYVDVGRLESIPIIIPVSEGKSYTDIVQFYQEAIKGLEEGTHSKIRDKYGNEIIRASGDYWTKLNNPDFYVTYGDNRYEILI
ncbi:hypothetical protein K9M74_03020 [Candidatus Woesearchaeota archaeon]|nr:hypothetical protein [Candidatus Woesearchaeota archaeon]